MKIILSLALISLTILVHAQEKGVKSEQDRQLYLTQLEKFKHGQLTPFEKRELALMAKASGEMATAQSVANEYINDYILKLRSDELFTNENLTFMGMFLGSPSSKAYKLFSTQAERINAVLGDYRAQIDIMKFINANYLPKGEYDKIAKPNWDSLEKVVVKKFGQLGEEITWGQRMLYHWIVKDDWKSFGKYYVLYYRRSLNHPPRFLINNMSWYGVFEHVNDSKVIEFAVKVMKYDIETHEQNNFQAWDTYANLLYKSGQTKQAIEWELKAVKMAKGTPDEQAITEALSKMQKGQPTWPVENHEN